MANTEVERHTGVDVEDVPSAQWGWSKENPRVIHISLLLGAAFLLAMLHGNHVGNVENAFLIGFAAVLVGWVARDWWLRRRGWTR
ncbi:hypothetical protein MDOR_14010 [Mycolicibacterium doricum]|uniref:DUF2631 domain-containing protein n=1 Tax=Mycolicibacterium doricum TaxID=126673 RepID=A0A1X1T864_9MYCO|nr:DUF2631 domain-containing protein [Mycolicibacterium doricum]MCV7268972.1 DUF2631 domain-containing protein [Mycolicibacterium doricum]ORV40708.1 hypothetical protein AWC01_11760 [Mycolicibacterium doricum]BBZ07232.1 hypothetical protein MDOR_14010 [Mycolicibacterium doricum]